MSIDLLMEPYAALCKAELPFFQACDRFVIGPSDLD